MATDAMYDLGSYNFQRGFGYLMADVLISGETESRSELASGDLATERARRAQAAIEEAVHSDPGNAHAWAALGWAFLRQGEAERAVDALHVSWEIAPYNRALADTRLSLVGVLSNPDVSDDALLETNKDGILRDAAVLKQYDKRTYDFYSEISPHLFALIESWESY